MTTDSGKQIKTRIIGFAFEKFTHHEESHIMKHKNKSTTERWNGTIKCAHKKKQEKIDDDDDGG